MSGSSSESSSRQTAVPLTRAQKDLQEVQLAAAFEQLGAFRDFQPFRRAATDTGAIGLADILGSRDLLSSLESTEQRDFARSQLEESVRSRERFGELSNLEFENIGRTGQATDEEIRLIGEASDAALAAGTSDIRESTNQAFSDLRQNLAPRLGLRSSDSPIIDRGGAIARQAIRSTERLSTNIRGAQAQAQLQFPLQRGQTVSGQIGQQQNIQSSRTDVLNFLQGQALNNRLALLGTTANIGLGAATGAINLPAAQQSLRPTLASFSESSSASGGISSRELKQEIGIVNREAVLEALNGLPIALYRYIADEDGRVHLGTFAEDFREAIGIGDGKTINYLDAIGTLIAGIQALSDRVRELEAEVEPLLAGT